MDDQSQLWFQFRLQRLATPPTPALPAPPALAVRGARSSAIEASWHG